MERNEESVWDLLDTIKKANTHMVVLQEGRRHREKKQKGYLKK